MEDKIILAFVGMPGAGKTEATTYLDKKGIPFVRFGDLTDEEVRVMNLPLTPENERMVREKLRKDFGMGAYAIKAEPKINELLKTNNIVILDGLYSWEEYIYLKNKFPSLLLINVYAEPKTRYERLLKRSIRPVPMGASRERDIAEIEKLNKGGPIAIADYLIENNSENMNGLYKNLDNLMGRLGIKNG